MPIMSVVEVGCRRWCFKMKVCTHCNIKKPKTEFYKRSNRPLGIQSLCKVCSSKKVKLIRVKSKAKFNEYRRKRRNSDLDYKLRESLRNRLRMALKGNQKGGSAVRDLGRSIPQFKAYLGSKFQEGMSWSNCGYEGWHTDHIKPLSAFDLKDPKQFKKAGHYTNLQPFWAYDNFTKSSRSVLK